MKRLITTECVSYGHPDKIADQISDALLDAYIEKDPNTKAGIETMVKDNIVVVGGEVMSNATIDADKIIRGVYGTLKFSPDHKLEPEQIKVINLIGKQSPQINAAVAKEDGDLGAGDQGFMVGYASNETGNFMPIGMHTARVLSNYVTGISGLGPDLKSQVTIEEDTETRQKRIHTILISTMHSDCSLEDLMEFLTNAIKRNNVGLDEKIFKLIDKDTKIVINPAGTWTIGGPVADCGLTGRKIVVDAYGASANVGGGSLSSKCPGKVDRSGAYLCRYIAKNIVAAGIADECKVEIAYMIGVAEPASINIELFDGNAIRFDDKLVEIVKEIFPMTPKQIIDHFDLKRPIYYNLAKNGHFGFEGDDNRPWEKTDKAEELKRLFKK